MQPRRDNRPATRADIQAALLNQLITVNNLYNAYDDERKRLIQLCKNYGITATRIRATIRRNK